MGFGVDSDSDGVWILIFCHGFLFFWIRMVGFWIPRGLGWIQIGWFGLTWWRCGMVATLVGGVWSSWVTVVALFGRRWFGGSVIVMFFAHCVGLI